ncbi:protein of unknown function [Xenorhabdus nematophila AN6/1]|nr:protein of unknown function [Xenorhabdus nematophila AN6/1]
MGSKRHHDFCHPVGMECHYPECACVKFYVHLQPNIWHRWLPNPRLFGLQSPWPESLQRGIAHLNHFYRDLVMYLPFPGFFLI